MGGAIKILSLCFVTGSILASQAHGRELQRMYRSPYFTGRGDTGISEADNQDAVLINPAGIAQGKGIYKSLVLASPMLEVSSDTRTLIKELAANNEPDPDQLRSHLGKNQHIGAYNYTGLILRRAAIGAVSAATTDVLVSKSPEDAGLEVVEAYASVIQGATFSLAHDFMNNHILIGTTLKYLVRGEGSITASVAEADKLKNLKDSDFFGYGTGAGADIGLMLRDESHLNPSFGLTVTDVGNTKFAAQDAGRSITPLYQKVNAGVSVSPGTKSTRFKLLADFKDIAGNETQNFYKRTHFGGELTFMGIVGVTGGLNQGYPCGGAYVDLRFVRIDGGAYTEEVGEKAGSRADKRFYVGLKAGF